MSLPAMKVLLEQWFSVLTTLTYFEICVLCKAQNRGARPWLAPVHGRHNSIATGSGSLIPIVMVVSLLIS